jgi:hypothetical protein
VFSGGMWLPLERLQMVSGARPDGYVLHTDETWTRYMDTSHAIHIVPTDSVVLREVIDNS